MSRVARVASDADSKTGPVGRFKHTAAWKPRRYYLGGASLEQRASFLLPDHPYCPGAPWASLSPLCASVSSSLIWEPWLFRNCGRNSYDKPAFLGRTVSPSVAAVTAGVAVIVAGVTPRPAPLLLLPSGDSHLPHPLHLTAQCLDGASVRSPELYLLLSMSGS